MNETKETNVIVQAYTTYDWQCPSCGIYNDDQDLDVTPFIGYEVECRDCKESFIVKDVVQNS